ncbi:MAG: hypothetical protein ACE5K4_04935 [Candidatus Hydrothermarchaeota archaeon]
MKMHALRKINTIKTNEKDISLVGKVLKVKKSKKFKKEITFGILRDETGKLPFISSKKFDFSEGDVILLRNVHTEGLLGIPRIIISQESTVERFFDERLSKYEDEPFFKLISELKNSSYFDISIKGFVKEIDPRSSIIHKCPTCKRLIKGNSCTDHGIVEPERDIKIIFNLEDGTGEITCYLKTKDSKRLRSQSFHHRNVHQELTEELLGRFLVVRGDVIRGKKGFNMNVNSIEFYKTSEEEVIQIINDLKGYNA